MHPSHLQIPTYKAEIDFSLWNPLSPHQWYDRRHNLDSWKLGYLTVQPKSSPHLTVHMCSSPFISHRNEQQILGKITMRVVRLCNRLLSMTTSGQEVMPSLMCSNFWLAWSGHASGPDGLQRSLPSELFYSIPFCSIPPHSMSQKLSASVYFIEKGQVNVISQSEAMCIIATMIIHPHYTGKSCSDLIN